MRAAEVKTDALFAALVLAPTVLSRNKHPELYRNPKMAGVRQRAREVRGFVRLAAGARGPCVIEAREGLQDGGERLRYRIDSIRLAGTLTLSAVERDVLDMALGSLTKVPVGPEVEARVMAVLGGLMNAVRFVDVPTA